MTHVNVFTKTAVELPEAPTALRFNHNYIQRLGPFLHISNGRRCSVTPLGALTVVMVDNHVGRVAYTRGSWFIVFDKASVKVPTNGALAVTNGNETATVTNGSTSRYNPGWNAGPKTSVGKMAPTLSNLLSVARGAEFERLPRAIATAFPDHIPAIIQFVFGLKFGAAYVTPTDQCIRQASNVGAVQVTTAHFTRVGGYVKSDNGVTYAVQEQQKYNVGDVAVVPSGGLPDNVSWNSKLTYKLPVREHSDGAVRRVTLNTILLRARQMRPPIATKQLTIEEACAPADPRRLLWGVSKHILPEAVTLLTRKSDKEQPNFLGTLGFKQKRDITFVRNLVTLDQNCTTDEAKRIMLSMRRGIAYADARASKAVSLPFRPGTLFRAPKCKVEYEKSKPPWKREAEILSRAVESDHDKYNEPSILLQATSKYWHSNADLRKWTGGAKPAVEAVWEPKIDGWRVLLHWTGDRLAWASNTGRDITSIMPEMLRKKVENACAALGAFILECELVAGNVVDCDAQYTAGITKENTRGVPKRTRASQVTARGTQHTLFVVDCIVENGLDVSNKSYLDRKTHAVKLMEALGLRIVPHFTVALDDKFNLTPEFVNNAYAAMLKSGIEGIVIKCTGLVYGAKHAVLKPVYYLTRPAAFPVVDAWDLFWCYAGVVYMGYIEADRAPWCLPIFGIKDASSKLSPTHPWHGYTPIHIEGYKVANRMMASANGYTQPHVIESYRQPTPWFSKGETTTTGCRRFLHRITKFTPRLLLVGEMVYERKDKVGWSFPWRIYLARSIIKHAPVDDTVSLKRRFGDMVLPEP